MLHITAWLAYSIFIFIANLLTKPSTSITSVLFYMAPYCVTFYLSVYCLGLYKKKGIIWSVASFFVVFIVMSSIGYIYIYILLPLVGVIVFSTTAFKPFLKDILLGYVRFFSFALLYFYIQESFSKGRSVSILQQEKSRLEQQKIQRELENAVLKQQELKAQQEKLQFEYAFLRSQINPHFLHNTLNMLFSQALNYSPELADNILKLSNIMRYSLESLQHESGKVSIQRELEHLQTLIEIHNLRFGNTSTIQYNVTGAINGQTIPPLSLITIVENAFKYGDIRDAEHPLLIDVVLKPGEINFYCKNKKKKNNIQPSSHNIGITNLSKRLDAAFKDKYKLKATDEADFYIFELTVTK